MNSKGLQNVQKSLMSNEIKQNKEETNYESNTWVGTRKAKKRVKNNVKKSHLGSGVRSLETYE